MIVGNAAQLLAKWDWMSPELPVDSWWFFSVVLVLLILFIWAIARLTARSTDDIDPAAIDRQMLTAVSELQREGEITEEEFRSIKGRLVERLAPETSSGATVSDKTDKPETGKVQEPVETKGTEHIDTNNEDSHQDTDLESP